VRTNAAGSYAVVEIRGGDLEGQHNDDDAILLKHYGFGWQALDSLRSACGRDAVLNMSTKVRKQLQRGIRPFPHTPSRRVETRPPDVGPSRDVEAVRSQMIAPFVPSAIVRGEYALASWYGAGGGKALFRRIEQKWRVVMGGGGSLQGMDLQFQGVPPADICRFRVPDCTVRNTNISATTIQAMRSFNATTRYGISIGFVTPTAYSRQATAHRIHTASGNARMRPSCTSAFILS
jgi:hypothetical protein